MQFVKHWLIFTAPLFVSPALTDEDKDRLREMNLRFIETDGTFFISQLKQHARAKMCLASDAMYEQVASQLMKVTDAHSWIHANFDMHKHPQMIFCSWYQDGLMHSLSRILRLRRLGTYSDLHKLIHSHRSYERYAKLYQRDKKYDDAAYCYGYATGYLYARASEEHPDVDPPKFFYFGAEIVAKTRYKKLSRSYLNCTKPHSSTPKKSSRNFRRAPAYFPTTEIS